MHKEAYKNNMAPYKKKGEANKELALPSLSKSAAKVALVRKISLVTGKFLGRLWASLLRRVKPAAKTLGPSGACLTLRPSPPLLNKTMLLAAGSALALPLNPGSPASDMLACKPAMEEINRRLINDFSDRLIDPSLTFTLDELTMLVYKGLDQHIIYLQSLDPIAFDLFLLSQSLAAATLLFAEVNNLWLDLTQPHEAYYNSFIDDFFPEIFIELVGVQGISLFFLIASVGGGFLFLHSFFKISNRLLEAQNNEGILNELFAAIDPSNEAALKEALKEIMGNNIIETQITDGLIAQQALWFEPAQAAFSWSMPYLSITFNALFEGVAYAPGVVYESLALTSNFSFIIIWFLYLVLIGKLLTKIKLSVIKFYNARKKGFKGGQKNT
jgi:hypothetical protein